MVAVVLLLASSDRIRQGFFPGWGVTEVRLFHVLAGGVVAVIAVATVLWFGVGLRQVVSRTRSRRGSAQAVFSRRSHAFTPTPEMLSNAVEQSPNSIIITSPDGAIEYVNPSFTQITGYTFGEVVGKNPSLLKSGDTPRRVYDRLWTEIRAGRNWRGELSNRRKDGSVYWDDVVVAPVTDPSGRVTQYLSIQTEITERKRAEERLRDSESRLRAIVNAAAEGILTFDPEGILHSFNPAAEGIFGYPADEVLGQSIERLVPGALSSLPAESSATDAAPPGGVEIVGCRRDGRAVVLEMVSSAFHDGVGPYYAALVRDVTQRRQMEEALRDERNFVSAILATSAALIMVLDPEGRVVRLNHACERAVGCSTEEVRDQVFVDRFMGTDDEGEIRRAFFDSPGTEFPVRLEGYLLTRDRTRRLIAWNNTVLRDRDDAVAYIIATGVDITEQRLAEEQARTHQTSLAHMDRVNLMGEMAAGLAHEINQPLTSIYAYARACQRLLDSGDTGSSRFRDALSQMARLSEQAGQIIHRLRDFSRRHELLKTAVDLEAVIREAVAFVQPELQRQSATTRLDIDPDLPSVWGDAVQIEQVLMNLIRNGLEAMVQGGAGPRILSIRAAPMGDGQVCVTVQDTGPGLPREGAEDLFGAFKSSKKDGIGMGLAISRNLIEALGGRLWADASAHNGGATFHFTLPVDEPGTDHG